MECFRMDCSLAFSAIKHAPSANNYRIIALPAPSQGHTQPISSLSTSLTPPASIHVRPECTPMLPTTRASPAILTVQPVFILQLTARVVLRDGRGLASFAIVHARISITSKMPLTAQNAVCSVWFAQALQRIVRVAWWQECTHHIWCQMGQVEHVIECAQQVTTQILMEEWAQTCVWLAMSHACIAVATLLLARIAIHPTSSTIAHVMRVVRQGISHMLQQEHV